MNLGYKLILPLASLCFLLLGFTFLTADEETGADTVPPLYLPKKWQRIFASTICFILAIVICIVFAIIL